MKKYKVVNEKHPMMGLNNKICREPKYWCRLHQIWLSEDDVISKGCKTKQSFDMLEIYECSCLQKKSYTEWKKKIKQKN